MINPFCSHPCLRSLISRKYIETKSLNDGSFELFTFLEDIDPTSVLFRQYVAIVCIFSPSLYWKCVHWLRTFYKRECNLHLTRFGHINCFTKFRQCCCSKVFILCFVFVFFENVYNKACTFASMVLFSIHIIAYEIYQMN